MAMNPWEYADKTGNEHAHQVALFMWCNMAVVMGIEAANDPLSYSVAGHARQAAADHLTVYGTPDTVPQLAWLHAIKNQGHGDAIRGAKSRAEGVKAGVPDVFLPVPVLAGIRNLPLCQTLEDGRRAMLTIHTGLYIELKRPDSVGKKAGKASDDQLKWAEALKANGYAVEVCVGWEAARDCILKYLGVA